MRAKWKGPFVNDGLLERVRRFVMSGKQQRAAFKVTSRSSTIVPEMMGLRFAVHNGHKFTPLEVRDYHLGHKFGEFAFTRVSPVSVYEHEMKKQLANAAGRAKKK